MRAYSKTTKHPFCLYLTSDELIDLVNEATDAIVNSPHSKERYPTLNKASIRLSALLTENR